MRDLAFFHAALALAAGMMAQLVAARLGVPSIVILLATGAILGPDLIGLLDPAAFGFGRGDLTTLAVTVILFEGGLGLDLERLRQQQRSLLLLLTLGAAISMAVGTWAAHAVLGMPWEVAALYGALVIVTGPTVVTPLLARLTIDRPVRELLVSEGVLIDPIGAIVAIVAAEYVLGQHAIVESGGRIVLTLGVGGAIGVGAGLLLAFALRRRWFSEELANATVLGIVLVVSAAASRISAEAGLMAAVAQGVTLGNARLRQLRRLREFKEALSVILLSFLFVVLAADLRFSEVRALGWDGIAVVALVVYVGRPLAVALATVGSGLSWRQRAFVAWICPRGVVAAAVAGLFRILLEQADVAGGYRLEALVFVTVAFTVTVQGLTARAVARLLGIDVPTPSGTLIVSADRLGRLLARLLGALGRQVAIVDRNPHLCRAARAEGLPVYEGDALMVETIEEAGARYADTVLALTSNGELNTLVAQRVRDNFRVERIFALADAGESDGDVHVTAGASPFAGDFPGVAEVTRLLHLGRLVVTEYEVPPGDAVGTTLAGLSYGPEEFALLHRRGDRVLIATAGQTLAAGDRLWCARPAKTTSPLAARFTVVAERDSRSLEPVRPRPA